MTTQCIHCLKYVEETTDDHVFPKSWFPASTPSSVQRWTAPSCRDCNNSLGKLEEQLLSRFALTIEPQKLEASGLGARVLRSYGIGAKNLNSKEQAIREKRRKAIEAEIRNFAGSKSIVPGSKPVSNESGKLPPAIPIDGSMMSKVYAKIVCGCEYVLGNGRYIELPYYLTVFGSNQIEQFEELMSEVRPITTLGPGFSIKRGYGDSDPKTVAYDITLWGSKRILAMVIVP